MKIILIAATNVAIFQILRHALLTVSRQAGHLKRLLPSWFMTLQFIRCCCDWLNIYLVNFAGRTPVAILAFVYVLDPLATCLLGVGAAGEKLITVA